MEKLFPYPCVSRSPPPPPPPPLTWRTQLSGLLLIENMNKFSTCFSRQLREVAISFLNVICNGNRTGLLLIVDKKITVDEYNPIVFVDSQ